jgi:hypothetical protein
MSDEKTEQDARKPYHRPEVQRFPLRPEEATLGNCKSASGGGPGGGAVCKRAGFNCKTQGS